MTSQKYSNNARTSRQSTKFLRDKRRRGIWIAGLIVVSAVAWTLTLSSLSGFGFLTIDTVKVNGADADINGPIQAAAMKALQGDYFGIFSKSNTIIFPRGAVAAAVRGTSERIENVSVTRDGLRSLVVNVQEKSPAALVCANLPDWNNGALVFDQSDDCYFADAGGMLYDHAPSFSGRVYNRYYMPDIGGASSTSASEFESLQRLYDSARAQRLDVQAMLIHGDGEYELYVSNTVVYFNNHTSLEDQLSNLISFWSNMTSKARAKGQSVQFDSIDVRYGSNVFYRLNSQ
jgi:cell division septal protein FtsQ